MLPQANCTPYELPRKSCYSLKEDLVYCFSAGVPVITRPKGTRQRRISRNLEPEILGFAQNDT
jgi:hypothetical protein